MIQHNEATRCTETSLQPLISPLDLIWIPHDTQEHLFCEEMSFRISLPTGFSLRDSVCSYGFFMLDPNRWIEHPDSVHKGCFRRPYHVPRGATATSRIGAMLSHTGPTDAEEAALLRTLIRMSPEEIGMVHVVITQEGAELCCTMEEEHVTGDDWRVLQAVLRGQIRRMLRLSARELEAQQAFAAAYCRQQCMNNVAIRSPYFTLDTALLVEQGPASDQGVEGCSKCGAARHNRGRLFRSPHVWEDALRTVTLCNISWPGTRRMNRLLCSAFGGLLPLPSQLIGMEAEQLQTMCGVGYRAGRILALAHAFLETPLQSPSPPPHTPPRVPNKKPSPPPLDLAWLEHPSRSEAEVYSQVLTLHGFGPYASSTLCMLLGHYASVPADTETVRHLLECHSINTCSPSSQGRGKGTPDEGKLKSAIDKLYGNYGPHMFMAYWDELWRFYVGKVGVGHMATLEQERYSDFTAVTMARMAGNGEKMAGKGEKAAAGKRKR